MSYMFLFIPMTFPAVVVYDRYGLRVGLLIAIFATTLGLWSRVFINKSFLWVTLGQTVMALAQPFSFNAPTKVTSNWFAEDERAFATMIGANANLLGIMLGFLLPSLFVSPFD